MNQLNHRNPIIILITYILYIGFVLLILGCTCPPDGDGIRHIYVDQSNVDGPWDGTYEHPYKTIDEGIIAAREGYRDVVYVRYGHYTENIIMKRKTELTATGNTAAMIDGNRNSPTITAKAGNRIKGFTIMGGTVGIYLNIGAIFEIQDETRITITECQIQDTHWGIQLETPTNLSFGDGVRKTIRLDIIHNWIRSLYGDGIRSSLTGPTTGELQISLNIRDNVLESTFTGITLKAKGQGANPDGSTRASYSGFIYNNLIIKGGNVGIDIEGENLGHIGVFIMNNTIAYNTHHGINSSTEIGADGYGKSHPHVSRNIIAFNGGFGYQEFGKFTSATVLSYNIFYQNIGGHYADEETGTIINTETGLNTPIVDGKVVFFSGSNNQLADPLFVRGEFRWKNMIDYSDPAEFFLKQDASPISPAVDAGDILVSDADLENRTTRTDYVFDTGITDVGFHYME